MPDLGPDPWFAPQIEPPYVGFMFSARIGADDDRRAAFVADVYRLAARSPGFIGVERSIPTASANAQSGDRHMISAIYWRDRESLDLWLAAVERLRPAADPRRDVARIYDFCVTRIVTVESVTISSLPPQHEPSD